MQGISCVVAPIPENAFFEWAKLEGLLRDTLFEFAGFAAQGFNLRRIRLTRCIACETLLASLEEFLRPALI
ncbi:hypothetical protein DT23_18750 [Thioclava indica]|uniref:Uncharacterized protein n=1 Tax=Thioclava indica TaxID=1353528 RepID=A0A074J9U2_9RHOB|nr:hypothetical protein DT23_18750 [Thioclava indica]